MSELVFLDSSDLADDIPPEFGGYDERPPDPDFDVPFATSSAAPKPEPKSGWPECERCGLPITTYGGRGRRPTMCDKCKAETGQKTRPRKSSTKTPDVSDKLTYITDGLIEYAGFIAAAVSAFAPVAGATMMMKAPRSMSALVEIAAMNHPRLLAGLEKFVAGRPYAVLGEFGAAIAYGAAVDFGQAEPVGFIAEGLGVAEAARQLGWRPEPEPVPANTGGGFLNTPPPPSFHLPE